MVEGNMRLFGPDVPEKEETIEETGLFIAASPIRLVLANKRSNVFVFVAQVKVKRNWIKLLGIFSVLDSFGAWRMHL